MSPSDPRKKQHDNPLHQPGRDVDALSWDKVTHGDGGFAWGPMEVKRSYVFRGSGVLLVTTDTGEQVEIQVSRTGKSLRVFRDGKEMRAT